MSEPLDVYYILLQQRVELQQPENEDPGAGRMRLALTLLRKKMPGGHIYTGKHRMYPRVTPEAIDNMTRRLQLEERNMFILRHPYLTLEQSFGHAGALDKSRAFYLRKRQEKEKWLVDVTLEERYDTLRNGDKWD